MIFVGCPLDERIEGFIADEVLASRQRHFDGSLGDVASGFYSIYSVPIVNFISTLVR